MLEAWRDEASRKFRAERGTLEAELGNWEHLLERFAEEHAPVYLRPDGETNAAVRRLRRGGVRLGAFTAAPERLGDDTAVVRTRDELLRFGA